MAMALALRDSGARDADLRPRAGQSFQDADYRHGMRVKISIFFASHFCN